VLAAAASALPPTLHATAFAMAVDLVLCDGRVEPREKAYIDSLQAALGVDEATALKIIECAR
jgi:tellurite resistance protein